MLTVHGRRDEDHDVGVGSGESPKNVAHVSKDWLDKSIDAGSGTAGQRSQEVGQASHDARVRRASHGSQAISHDGQPLAADDLAVLHQRACAPIESRHVLDDVRVANDGKTPLLGHLRVPRVLGPVRNPQVLQRPSRFTNFLTRRLFLTVLFLFSRFTPEKQELKK